MSSNNGVASKWSEKQVFTTGEAAEICKVSQQTIIRNFDSGRLSGFRVPGSRFRRIPRKDLLQFMRANDIPTDTLEDATRRILVVDDDDQIIDLFRDIFGGDDRFELRTAGTGYDAGMLTQQFRPHLILLDYMLPDLNGNLVCQRIKSNPEFQDTHVIIVSGVVSGDEIDSLRQHGADDFIQKPFDVDQIMSRVCELLEV